ncbi:hypothetical protein FH972_009066 [Carpinus fangiana]|uniref:Thioredoxin domain-containing protein n=1 Tax=Carpinus fangiana TaxID=176857 RepID=A0A5N6R1K1_9ROSI|nr:hypothetical protein FH972_009066 [Carpinus fangiana]
MGGKLSDNASETSHVLAFHSKVQWQSHFEATKQTDKLSVAREYAVDAMPTFILIKNGKVVDKVVGATKEELRRKIEKHRT